MLLLFSLFSNREQLSDAHQTGKKLLLGTWLLGETCIILQRVGILYTPQF